MTTIVEKTLADKLLGMAFTIYNILGPGLLEECYKEAFCVELRLAHIPFERQKVYPLAARPTIWPNNAAPSAVWKS